MMRMRMARQSQIPINDKREEDRYRTKGKLEVNSR